MRGDHASFFPHRAQALLPRQEIAAAPSADPIDGNPVAWLIGRHRAHHPAHVTATVLTIAPMLFLLVRVYAPEWLGLRQAGLGRFGLFVCYVQAVLVPVGIIYLTLAGWNYYASVVWLRRRRAWEGLFLSRLTPPEYLAGLAEAAHRTTAAQRGVLLRGATLAALPFPDLLLVAAALLALHHRVDLARLASRWLLPRERRTPPPAGRAARPWHSPEIEAQPTLLLIGVRSYAMAAFMAIMPMASIVMLVGLLTISWMTLSVVAVTLFFFLMWGSYLESPEASRDDDAFAASMRAWLRRPAAARTAAVDAPAAPVAVAATAAGTAATGTPAAVTPPPHPPEGA